MSAAGQAVVTCWNCDQAVQATATSCLWCGVAVQPTVTPIVVAPGGPPSSPAPAAASAPALEPQYVPPVAAAHAPYSPPPRTPKREAVPLGGAFAGTSSSVGAQVAAFTIDVFAIAAITVTVHLAVGNALITALTLVEALVFLWVLEARTGLTVGHLLLRIRSSRAEAPYSPGAGRAFVRQTVLNAGLVVAVVGAWVVASSGAWDSSGQQRSLAAKASGTRAVKPLAKARSSHSAGAHVTGPIPGAVPAVSPGGGLAAPRVVSTSTLRAPSIEDSHSVPATGATPHQGDHTAPQLVTSLDPAAPAQQEYHGEHAAHDPQPIAPVPGAAVPESQPQQGQVAPPPFADDYSQAHYPAPDPAGQQLPPITPDQAYPHPEYAQPEYADPASAAPPQAVPHYTDPLAATPPATASDSPAIATTPAAHTPAEGGALLLVFDTGQRATLAVGTAINLGRKPSPIDPTDQLVAVEDPDGTVSKFHARLEHSRGHTWVTDQGSTNGTDLLDEDGATRLEPGVRTLIAEGTRARIGNRSFTVSVLLDPVPSPETPT